MKKVLEKEVEHLLRSLRTDAKMALNGEWNKSDKGFQAQITAINRVLTKIDKDNEYSSVQE